MGPKFFTKSAQHDRLFLKPVVGDGYGPPLRMPYVGWVFKASMQTEAAGWPFGERMPSDNTPKIPSPYATCSST